MRGNWGQGGAEYIPFLLGANAPLGLPRRYADAHLIVVKIECPNPQHASAATVDKFYGSQARYPLGMIPTCVVLDGDGKTLGTLAGYPDGGPKALVRQLEKL